MEKILAHEQPIIYGSGNKTRDYIFVSDVVEANIKALQHHGIGAFNVGTGTETNVNTIFRLIRSQLNLDIPEIHTGEEAGEQLRSVLDITKAKRFLGWEPKVSFAEGLKITIDWYLSQH
jgi:UDP-glucose 4-epimerase